MLQTVSTHEYAAVRRATPTTCRSWRPSCRSCAATRRPAAAVSPGQTAAQQRRCRCDTWSSEHGALALGRQSMPSAGYCKVLESKAAVLPCSWYVVATSAGAACASSPRAPAVAGDGPLGRHRRRRAIQPADVPDRSRAAGPRQRPWSRLHAHARSGRQHAGLGAHDDLQAQLVLHVICQHAQTGPWRTAAVPEAPGCAKFVCEGPCKASVPWTEVLEPCLGRTRRLASTWWRVC